MVYTGLHFCLVYASTLHSSQSGEWCTTQSQSITVDSGSTRTRNLIPSIQSRHLTKHRFTALLPMIVSMICYHHKEYQPTPPNTSCLTHNLNVIPKVGLVSTSLRVGPPKNVRAPGLNCRPLTSTSLCCKHL